MGKWMLLLVLAHAADLWTTHLGLSRGCVELNPLYGLVGYWMPAMIAIKGLCVALIEAIAWTANPRTRRVALWTGIVAGFGAAAWNIIVIPQC